jgi:hypothetical protein
MAGGVQAGCLDCGNAVEVRKATRNPEGYVSFYTQWTGTCLVRILLKSGIRYKVCLIRRKEINRNRGRRKYINM